MNLFEQFISDLKNVLRQEMQSALENAIETTRKKSINPEKKYLTKKEAAKYLNMSIPTLDKCTHLGLVESFRVGSNIRYLTSELDRSMLKRKFKAD